MENKVVKAPELEKVVESTKMKARVMLKEKVSVVKGIQYDHKAVKMGRTWSASFKEVMSKAYAFKSACYDVDSKYRNNVAYLSKEIERISEKSELTDTDLAYLELCLADRARSQACLHAWNKQAKNSVKPILWDIESRLYKAYAYRMVNKEMWWTALKEFMESYEMEFDDSLAVFLDTNIGSRVAKTRDYHACMVDNMTPSQFSELVLALFLQLGVDKAQFSMKIIESTLEGVSAIMIEEFDSFKTIKAVDLDRGTIAQFKAVLEQVGAELPKEKTKKEYKQAYLVAKKQGLFVEY